MKGLYWIVTVLFLFGCKEQEKKKEPKEVKQTNTVKLQIDSLKRVAQLGDLVLRLGDDMLSYSIRFLSEQDKSFSHSGIIAEHNGEKVVCHIYPHENDADTIQYEPIDTFINPLKNVQCGLYRYDLSSSEQGDFFSQIDVYRKKKVHFDRLYDLRTGDKLYCTEMIAKALAASTHNRIHIKETYLPKAMLPMMYNYFKNEKASHEEIAARKYIAIDNLYLNPNCKQVMKFALRPPSQ